MHMTAPAQTQTAAPEEVKFPDRDITFSRLASVERNAGAVCAKFVHSFRQSCFRFVTKLNRNQTPKLSPTRAALVAHLRNEAPDYVFPKCFVCGNDLRSEQKVVKAQDDTEVTKFRWKQSRIATVGSDEEPEEKSSDEERQKPEEEDEDELIGEYNVAEYEDQERDETDDESSEDD